jgi:predicted metal-binding membrane protein
MSSTSFLVTGSKFSFLVERIRILYIRNPEYRALLFSLCAWAFLVANLFAAPHDGMHSGSITYCMPVAKAPVVGHLTYEGQNILEEEPLSSRILSMVLNGLPGWIIMVIAMMFPLLNEPLKHVAFSVKQKDRGFAISEFLIGYTLIWAIAGASFLSLPVICGIVVSHQTHFINGIVKASGFLLAAALLWYPARPVVMSKCSQTIPIRIQGWQLHFDSGYYGLKTGLACLAICWAPMAALMLAHHNFFLMYVVTIVLVCERYLLPHTSKLPAYAWGIIALTLFGIEMWG